jgi:hypothetical protein
MNIRGGETAFEMSYVVLALQMLPHAVGFFKRGRRPQPIRASDAASKQSKEKKLVFSARFYRVLVKKPPG